MRVPGVHPAIARAAAFLAAVQELDGSFVSQSSAVALPFKATKVYRTSFAPAVMLGALAGVSHPSIQPVRARLADWLLAQKSSHWSFNYWAKDTPERKSLPYPDDLDDTFCALFALHRHDPKLIDGACLGAIARLLIATETTVGGPYRTWLVAASAPAVWHDVDLAVNSNIAAFLRRVADPLPNVTALLETAIAKQEYSSPYYPSPYPLWYYLARAYTGPLRTALRQHILQAQIDDTWETPLQTALALSALRELGHRGDMRKAHAFLLRTQQPGGGWAAEAFCLDPARQGRQHYNGAATLTTAFVLEALSVTSHTTPRATSQPAEATTLYRQAFREAATLPVPLRPSFKKLLTSMRGGDHGGEIVLLPQRTARSLRIAPETIPPDTYEHLSRATLYGWLAYTVFDDFLDDEGQPRHLPPAAAALRLSLEHFYDALPAHAAFQQLVRSTFDRIDAANALELAACRAPVHDGQLELAALPPNPGMLWLAERSLGHSLAPLGVLAAHGTPPGSKPAQQLLQAIRHYLAARQLSDDMHDWEADLRAGHLTLVVGELLRDHSLQPGSYDLTTLLPALQRTFWHHSVTRLCALVTQQTTAARRAMQRSGLFIPQHFLERELARLDGVMAHTLHEQQSAKSFLQSYRTTAKP